MIAGRQSRYRGTQGTSICQIFEGVIAPTGPSEKVLRQLGDTDFEKVYLYGTPTRAITRAPSDGEWCSSGSPTAACSAHRCSARTAVPKRIDAFAMAIQMGATVYDLEEAELCYAPPFGSAKDAVNFAGMVAGDLLRGDMPLAHWDGHRNAFLLDVRPPELVVETVPGAQHSAPPASRPSR